MGAPAAISGQQGGGGDLPDAYKAYLELMKQQTSQRGVGKQRGSSRRDNLVIRQEPLNVTRQEHQEEAMGGVRGAPEQLYERERRAHYVADEGPHRVMQDVSYSFTGQFRREVAAAIENLFSPPPDTDLQEALREIEDVQTDTLTSRFHSLMELRDGWLDGKGKAPPHDFLRWLVGQFKNQYPVGLPRPYIYPTPDGGIQAEWSLGPCDVSLTIDSKTYEAAWHALNLDTDHEDEHTIHLGESGEWQRLISNIVLLLRSHGESG